MKLVNVLENVIQALSILLFDFGMIRGVARQLATMLDSGLAQAQAAMQNKDASAINGFFGKADAEIQNLFAELAGKVKPPALAGAAAASGSLAGLAGGHGSTPHAIFTVGRKNPPTQKSSHAVQCTWAARTLKQHYKQGTTAPGPSELATTGSLPDFLSSFQAKLTSPTGDLNGDYANGQNAYGQNVNTSSARQWGGGAADVFLGVMEDVVIDVLKIVRAFIDGALKITEEILTTLTAMLTTELHIPVLTSLWNAVTGEPLSLQGVSNCRRRRDRIRLQNVQQPRATLNRVSRGVIRFPELKFGRPKFLRQCCRPARRVGVPERKQVGAVERTYLLDLSRNT
jgi:hypothetical protein